MVIQERNLYLGLGWDISKKKSIFSAIHVLYLHLLTLNFLAIDLDASVVLLDSNKCIIDHASFDKKEDDQKAIHHQGDNRTGVWVFFSNELNSNKLSYYVGGLWR